MTHQHSAKFPACPECRHFNGTDDAEFPCIYCRDAAHFGRRPGPVPTRAGIDSAVLAVLGGYLRHPVGLDQHVADLGLRSIDAIQAMLDLEDEYEDWGLTLVGRVDWDTARDLADQVALQVLPGESGEVIDPADRADDTLAACAAPAVAATRKGG